MAKQSSSDVKPVPDVYVALLFVSTAALIAAITLLALELNKYDWALPR